MACQEVNHNIKQSRAAHQPQQQALSRSERRSHAGISRSDGRGSARILWQSKGGRNLPRCWQRAGMEATPGATDGLICAAAARFLRRQRDSCDDGVIHGDGGAGGRLQRQRRRSIQYACEGRNRETECWAVGLGLLMGYERMASSRVLAVSLPSPPPYRHFFFSFNSGKLGHARDTRIGAYRPDTRIGYVRDGDTLRSDVSVLRSLYLLQ